MERKSVIIVNSNGDTLKMVKAIKECLHMGLKDAKDLHDQIPCIIKELPAVMAENLVSNIRSFGGIAYIDQSTLKTFVYCGTCKQI